MTADTGLPARIGEHTTRLEELAQPVLAAHTARLWDEVIGILDRFALALGDQRIPAARLEELFTLLCRTVDMGHIPHGLDAIETRYSTYSKETEQNAIDLAEEYGILQSGGSDFHGKSKPTISLGTGEGSLRVPYELLQQLKTKIS
jgi:hypothetical protein